MSLAIAPRLGCRTPSRAESELGLSYKNRARKANRPEFLSSRSNGFFAASEAARRPPHAQRGARWTHSGAPRQRSDVLLVWGPVSVEESQSVGASHPASSVVLQLCVPEELRRAVLAEVPADVLPRPDDDAKSLNKTSV